VPQFSGNLHRCGNRANGAVLTAAQFAAHAQMYQTFSAQAAAIHEQLVATLATSAGSYRATEAANAAAAR
jgi:PE family